LFIFFIPYKLPKFAFLLGYMYMYFIVHYTVIKSGKIQKLPEIYKLTLYQKTVCGVCGQNVPQVVAVRHYSHHRLPPACVVSLSTPLVIRWVGPPAGGPLLLLPLLRNEFLGAAERGRGRIGKRRLNYSQRARATANPKSNVSPGRRYTHGRRCLSRWPLVSHRRRIRGRRL